MGVSYTNVSLKPQVSLLKALSKQVADLRKEMAQESRLLATTFSVLTERRDKSSPIFRKLLLLLSLP
jgi:hypothetical protein